MVDPTAPPPPNGAAPGSPGAEAVAELNQAWLAALEAETQPDVGVAAWPVDAQEIDAVDAAGLQALLALDGPLPSQPEPMPAHPGPGPRLRLVPSPLRAADAEAAAPPSSLAKPGGAAPD